MKKYGIAKLLVLVGLLLPAGCLSSTFQTGVIQTDCGIGPRDNCLVYLPRSYSTARKWPLIIFLHGSGERGRNLDVVRNFAPNVYLAQHDDMPFVLVSLQCSKGFGWENNQIIDAVNYMMKAYSIDEDRVSVTGVSMGGFGTWSVIAEYPWIFSAAAPLCGGADKSIARSVKELPIWMFHGEKDGTVPIAPAETLYAELIKAGAKDVKFTRYPDMGHDIWDTTYASSAIYDWLIAQKRRPQVLAERIRYTNRFSNPFPLPIARNEKTRVERWIYNPSWQPMKVSFAWETAANPFWQAGPASASITVAPHSSDSINVELNFTGDPLVRNDVLPLPGLSLKYAIGDSAIVEESPSVSMQFNAECRITAARAKGAMKIDGDLSDKTWKSIRPDAHFVDANLESNPRKDTEVRTAWDAQNLYLAFRCLEDMDGTPPAPKLKGRDADYWRENAIEIFIDSKNDPKDYFHIVANSAGDFYDANKVFNREWNGNITVKAGKEQDAWTLEIAIPWKEIEVPKAEIGKTVRINFVRDRIAGAIRESSQWSPTFADNHKPDRFGTLVLSR